jgi:large subunit ribosomal protein L30
MAKTNNTPKQVESVSGGTVKVRLVKGLRGTQARHRLSVKALGLNKINDVRELPDNPSVRGLIATVYYLVQVEQ